jgi:hypothetical protein
MFQEHYKVLSSWRSEIPEKLTITTAVQKISAFHGT